MSTPVVVINESFQHAWANVVHLLHGCGWDCHNLVVQITDPLVFCSTEHSMVEAFAGSNDLQSPREVANTIFPSGIYRRSRSAAELFDRYDRIYPRIMHRNHGGWGTYFRRMTSYGPPGSETNQLQNIINAIQSRSMTHSSAYTIVIPQPGGETTRPRGGPCLHYLAIQLDSNTRSLGLLAVYRNHDFLRRAYGNYWGLCELTSFLANETGMSMGMVTCVSSHAYVAGMKRRLISLMEQLEI
ncbi:MAG: thymidylate synthase family protein [Armatimonadota bacterium]